MVSESFKCPIKVIFTFNFQENRSSRKCQPNIRNTNKLKQTYPILVGFVCIIHQNTMLNAFNNLTAPGCVQKMSCTTSSSFITCQWMYISCSNKFIKYHIYVLGLPWDLQYAALTIYTCLIVVTFLFVVLFQCQKNICRLHHTRCHINKHCLLIIR